MCQPPAAAFINNIKKPPKKSKNIAVNVEKNIEILKYVS